MKEDILNSWGVKKLIGKGNFGSVYELENDGEKEAMKVVNIYPKNSDFNKILGTDNHAELEDKMSQIIKEIDMLYHLKGNTHIVNYIDHYIDKQDDAYSLYLKMEYLQGLNDYYEEEIESCKALLIMYDVLDALTICEDNQIVHGDIKPQNIMVDSQGNNKLTDFGISKIISGQKVNSYTPAYAAPEIITNQKYTKQSDLYSLGLVIYQIYNNNLLPFMKEDFQKKDVTKIIENRITMDIPAPLNGTKELNEFLSKALNRNPEARFQSAKEMREELQRLDNNNLLPKVLVVLPIMLAVAIKFNSFNVFGAEMRKQAVKAETKKTFLNSLTSMSITTKAIIGVVISLIIGGGVFAGINGNVFSSFGETNESMKIYKSLDAKETYEKLLNKMDTEVTYYRANIDDVGTIFYRNETYCIDGKISIVQKRKDETPGYEFFEYSISELKKHYALGQNSQDSKLNYFEYDVDDDFSNKIMNSYYTNDYYTVKDIFREEKDGEISLIFHLISHNEGTQYILATLVLNKEGFLAKETNDLMDEKYENVIRKNSTITYSDYNKKSVENLNEEKKLLKSCDGLTEKEAIEKSGFKK